MSLDASQQTLREYVRRNARPRWWVCAAEDSTLATIAPPSREGGDVDAAGQVVIKSGRRVRFDLGVGADRRDEAGPDGAEELLDGGERVAAEPEGLVPQVVLRVAAVRGWHDAREHQR